jgi:hypothetical protein
LRVSVLQRTNLNGIEFKDFMIGAMDERGYGPTHTHTLATSHSPFYSQPSALADILMGIAGNARRGEAREKERA